MRTLLILTILLFPNVSMSNNIYKKIEILSVEIEKEVIKKGIEKSKIQSKITK